MGVFHIFKVVLMVPSHATHHILCITCFLGHLIERQLHGSLQTNLKECNFVKYLYIPEMRNLQFPPITENWMTLLLYIFKIWTIIGIYEYYNKGNFLFFVFLLKSRHCVKYTRIRVFTDPCSPVYGSVKNPYSPIFYAVGNQKSPVSRIGALRTLSNT